ncbi:hypothetical protein LV82_00889 [Albidovulum inexpectatum]|uniref:DUF192 domain-containing protein n=1 Tax=Albidovulum inexpectatum TaxID=196587 RepID=A0A2S5JJI6_9RHOB|nr:hypothetical protein LV82_00889 [Albidovulum inexpectatum]
MIRHWRSRLACAAAGLFVCAGASWAACAPGVAEFRWDGGAARFSVEIADDESERARGLMHRESLPRGAGMLFVYDRPGPVAFWMKNTLIPLDMIFVAPDGRVTAVHSMAKPLDLTPIPGPSDTVMVLEINGGLARALGLGPGAVMRHPRLDQDKALWPCS